MSKRGSGRQGGRGQVGICLNPLFESSFTKAYKVLLFPYSKQPLQARAGKKRAGGRGGRAGGLRG